MLLKQNVSLLKMQKIRIHLDLAPLVYNFCFCWGYRQIPTSRIDFDFPVPPSFSLIRNQSYRTKGSNAHLLLEYWPLFGILLIVQYCSSVLYLVTQRSIVQFWYSVYGLWWQQHTTNSDGHETLQCSFALSYPLASLSLSTLLDNIVKTCNLPCHQQKLQIMIMHETTVQVQVIYQCQLAVRNRCCHTSRSPVVRFVRALLQ